MASRCRFSRSWSAGQLRSIGGRVAEAQKAGRVEGVARLGVQLTDLSLVDGQQVPIQSQLVSRTAPIYRRPRGRSSESRPRRRCGAPGSAANRPEPGGWPAGADSVAVGQPDSSDLSAAAWPKLRKPAASKVWRAWECS